MKSENLDAHLVRWLAASLKGEQPPEPPRRETPDVRLAKLIHDQARTRP